MVTFLLPLPQNGREFFLDFHCENLVVFLKGKHENWGFPNTGPWGISHYHTSPHPDSRNLSQSLQKCPYQILAFRGFCSGRVALGYDSLYSRVLSGFQGGGLPCGPHSLIDLKFTDFHFVQNCSCFLDVSDNFQLLYMLELNGLFFKFQL